MSGTLKSITISHALVIIAMLLAGAAMFFNVKAHAERNEIGYKAADAAIRESCDIKLGHILYTITDIKISINKLSEKL